MGAEFESSEFAWVPLTAERYVGSVEQVHAFYSQMPSGVAVSDSGRRFVSYPRWDDDVQYTVAELRDGEEVPYPNARVNTLDREGPETCLLSVHRLVIDPEERLWLLDSGSINLDDTIPGGPKLVCVDLERDEIVRSIPFPPDIAFATAYLNDVRFDLGRGGAGLAFISDSGRDGPSGFVVVDLASGRSWRHLTGHHTVRPVPSFVPFVEGRPVALSIRPGVDGIALSPDGRRLYYSAVCSRRLFSVSADGLADEGCAYEDLAATISDLGEKGACDGMEADAEGRLYFSNYEHGSLCWTHPGEPCRTLVHQPGMLFVDTLCLAADGHLYFTANQLHRHPLFHDGEDLRQPPYRLMRTRVDATPVRLAR